MEYQAELRKRMAKHITALIFDQIDNNGEWMVHQEYAEALVDNALTDWRAQFNPVSENKSILNAIKAQGYYCCTADFGTHEPTCKNYI